MKKNGNIIPAVKLHPQVCSKLSHVVYQILGVKIATSSYHPNGNGGVERVTHTAAQMLAMVANEFQNNLDEQLPRVEFVYNNPVSIATGSAPNGVHMGRLPRLPPTIFERVGVASHQSLACDHLAYCDLATDHQQRANDTVRGHHAHTVARSNRRNSALSHATLEVHHFVSGDPRLGSYFTKRKPPENAHPDEQSRGPRLQKKKSFFKQDCHSADFGMRSRIIQKPFYRKRATSIVQ